MLNVNVYGCSYTGGTPKVLKGYSWVDELQQLEPEWNIKNYAKPGSSIHYTARKYYDNKFESAFNILQIPHYNRWSYFKGPISYGWHHNENHLRNRHLNDPKFPPENIKLAAEYYIQRLRTFSDYELAFDSYAYAKLLVNDMNIVFYHHSDKNKKLCPWGYPEFKIDTFTIEEECPKFKEYSADIVNHFNVEGMNWQANFIREKIKKTLYNLLEI